MTIARLNIPDKRVIAVWKKSANMQQCATTLGTSRSFVEKILVRNGLHQYRPTKESRSVDYNAVIDFYKASQNYPETAAKFGVCVSTVRRICQIHGVTPGKGNARYKGKNDLPMDQIIERYKKGETCAEIGRDFGVDNEVIRRRLKRRGVDRRGGGPRSPEKNSQWNGGRYYSENHHAARKIAQTALGRKLEKGEIAHHQNEKARDNSLENLWIFSSQTDHLRYHGKLRSLRNQGLEVDAIQMALESGGVPLLELASRSESSPDKDLLAP
jgi:hypothetical protein